jgi:hypothetical protein
VKIKGAPTNENEKKVECEKGHLRNSIFKKHPKKNPKSHPI